mmetsp:Transcript_67914/g.108713  ORF Transcript_67914/g.108713 Transcript_67914/m.108713 type:complete len:95 (+) Transcript_67914:460-744(+)
MAPTLSGRQCRLLDSVHLQKFQICWIGRGLGKSQIRCPLKVTRKATHPKTLVQQHHHYHRPYTSMQSGLQKVLARKDVGMKINARTEARGTHFC